MKSQREQTKLVSLSLPGETVTEDIRQRIALSRLHLNTQTESSLPNAMFEIKDRTMANVQNCDSYINIP
jgi:hypothetical protein